MEEKTNIPRNPLAPYIDHDRSGGSQHR